jgi:hypothetical protein
MLPCGRTGEGVIVISTYGERAHWLRNLEADPHVRFTARGELLDGVAEVVRDAARRREIVERDPFVPIVPVGFAQALARGALRGAAVAWLRGWVASRPVVVIRAERAQVG